MPAHFVITIYKYVVVRPLKSKTTDEVIENIYLDVGVPDVIQHDQDKEFTSNVCLIKDAIII